MITLLGQTLDRTQQPVDIFHTDLDFSRVYTSYLRAHADLVDQKIKYAQSSWAAFPTELVYAEQADRVLGFIEFMLQEGVGNQGHKDLCTVGMIWVDPSCRSQGIFTAMLTRLEQHLKARDVVFLHVSVHHSYTELRAQLERQGFAVKFLALDQGV